VNLVCGQDKAALGIAVESPQQSEDLQRKARPEHVLILNFWMYHRGECPN